MVAGRKRGEMSEVHAESKSQSMRPFLAVGQGAAGLSVARGDAAGRENKATAFRRWLPSRGAGDGTP